MSHITQEAIDTEKRIGHTVGSQTVENEMRRLADKNPRAVDNAIALAAERGWLVICIIDDYTTIHAKHRPTNSTTSQVNSAHDHLPNIPENSFKIPLKQL